MLIRTAKSVLVILGFLLLSLNVVGQSLSSKKPYIKQKNYYQEIPFDYVRGKIIVPVTLEGEVYRFILDTGAPNILSTHLAKKLGVILSDSIKVSDANETKQQMALVKVPKFSLSSLDFYNSSALVHTIETDDIFNCFQIDGFIGSNVLHHSVIQIDHKRRKIIITDAINNVTVNKKSKTKLQLFGSQKSPYVWVTLGDESKNQVLLDTGMEGSYDISLKAHNTFSKKDFYKPIGKGDGAAGIGLFGTGKNTTHYRTLIHKIELSTTIFKNILAETTTDTNSRVGSSFFEQGISTFDFNKKKFYFESYVTSPNLSEKLLGFSPTLKDTKLVVGIVWQDELRQKIQTGDEILSVNGKTLKNIPICDLMTTASIFRGSDTLILTVRNSKGEINEVITNRTFSN